jgi:hypothetical protein
MVKASAKNEVFERGWKWCDLFVKVAAHIHSPISLLAGEGLVKFFFLGNLAYNIFYVFIWDLR